ncbi:MAG: hypothetical protein KKA51_02465 [Nanoarchaeota archaeon]|nr:hypothetical protein [Nanoarchaeota archaeon]MBU1269672.1 hypothetical protein [Nanoarchaeota archaeon]MBU2443749.1 hypothetical protein [Nanoarchaeota archaeon]
MERGTDITNFKRVYRERNVGDFPLNLTLRLRKQDDKKYGENPSQHCAVYKIDEINNEYAGVLPRMLNINYARTDDEGKGGLSLTNEMDIARAMDVLKFFDEPAVVIMKHNIVSGFAKQVDSNQTLADLFRLARDADLRSNFGGTAVFNRHLDMKTAEALYELKGKNPFFVDVLAAINYNELVLDYVQSQSKSVRIAQISSPYAIPKFTGDSTYNLLSFKEMPTGRVGVQDLYLTSIKSSEDLIMRPMVVDKKGEHYIRRGADKRELDDLLTSWYINVAGARSNGVVFVKNGVSVAIGSGQVERVGAIEQAIVKGVQKYMDKKGFKYDSLKGIGDNDLFMREAFEGAVCSSDAFFPFADSIELLARAGVTAVVQPYGSVNDGAVIDAANNYLIAMPATLERAFGHF